MDQVYLNTYESIFTLRDDWLISSVVVETNQQIKEQNND